MEVSEKLLIPKRIIFHNWSTIIFLHIYIYIYVYIYIHTYIYIYGGFLNYTIYFPPFFPSLLILNWSMTDHMVSCLNWDPHQRTAAWRMGKKMSISYHPWKNLWSIWSPVQNVFFELRFFLAKSDFGDHFGMIQSQSLHPFWPKGPGKLVAFDTVRRHLDAVVLGSTALLGLVSSRFFHKGDWVYPGRTVDKHGLIPTKSAKRIKRWSWTKNLRSNRTNRLKLVWKLIHQNQGFYHLK